MQTIKIVINADYGGFGLSDEAINRYKEIKGIKDDDFDPYEFYYKGSNNGISRADPVLVSIVEEMKEKSFGPYSQLKIVEIPSDVEWVIEDYDGNEWVAEKHRVWS